jgi:hypothetical protein
MENNFDIAKELRSASVEFLTSFANYEKCLNLLRDENKQSFTETEVNDILNLLGAFRLREVFHLVERYKIEVTQLKPQTGEETEPKEEPAEKE